MASPAILTLDIETAPATAFIWKTWKENVSPDQVITPPRTLCFAAKWHDVDDVEYYGENEQSHGEMIRAAWDLLDRADWVVHYNGMAFDIPHLQREFIQARLGPPSPYKQIDLIKTARHQFRFLSNRLQQVSTELGLEGKFHTDFLLWRRIVMDNDPDAWAEMKRYVIQDVRDEEQVYDMLRPWIPGHPNMALYLDRVAAQPGDLADADGYVRVCPNCGSNNVQRRGTATTQVGKFPRYHCQTCGKWSRGAHRIDHADIRQFAG